MSPPLQRPEVTQARAISAATTRVVGLDALRGFALCGILIVNIYQQVLGRVVHPGHLSLVLTDTPAWVQWLFVGRFFPIFSVLFGIGFALFLTGAAKRTERPRIVLARRLLVLLMLGAIHWLFHPGEVLAMYAVSGLIILLPLSFTTPRVGLWVSVGLTVLGGMFAGHAGLIPGLIGVGYALGRFGILTAITSRPKVVAATLGISVLAVAGLGFLVVGQVELPSVLAARLTGSLWGVATASAYACAFILVLHTPVGLPLSRLLAPLGRMALTNYLGATALMLIIGPAVGIDSYTDIHRIVALTVGILAGQILASALWLRVFRYGPLEWVWRCLTWWQIAPLRGRAR